MQPSGRSAEEIIDLQPSLSRAEQQADSYDWRGAAASYQRILGTLTNEDSPTACKLREELAQSMFKTALQSENTPEFRRTMRDVITSYRDARRHFENGGDQYRPAAIRCEALAELLSAWVTTDLQEKRTLLREGWKLGKDALRDLKEINDQNYWKTYCQLAIYARMIFHLEWSYQARETLAREFSEFGEEAIHSLRKTEDPIQLARVYAITANSTQALCNLSTSMPQAEKDRLEEKARSYWSRAVQLSEKTALLELGSSGLDGLLSSLWRAGAGESIATMTKALGHAKESKDRLIIGGILAWQAYHTFWKASLTEEPQEATILANEALDLAHVSKTNLETIALNHPRGSYFVGAPEPDHYLLLAVHETDGKRRRNLLRKALEETPKLVASASESGYPTAILESHRVFARILFLLAKMETDPGEKTHLLEASLQHREEVARVRENMRPFDESSDGTDLNYLADIESEMAGATTNREIRTSLLKQAIVNKELSLRLFLKYLASHTKKGPPTQLAVLARWTDEYGDLLKILWETTGDRAHLEKAAISFWDAAEYYEMFDLNSRVAECYSRAGRAYDSLDEYAKATDAFNLASNNYSMAAQRIPVLKNFSQDQSSHMQAWSEIEKARHHHSGGESMLAKKHFETAANLEQTTKQWSFLGPYYSAWARLEEGEGLSGTEENESAMHAFQNASEQFQKSAQGLRDSVGESYERDHDEMIAKLAKAAELSREYCIARVACEEAVIFDRKGDDYSSSEKFREAADILGKVAERAESSLDKRRTANIRTFVLALGTMTRAEVESSSKLYLEASRLFQQSMEGSPNQKARMLSQGHSKFCLALEAGTSFVNTKNNRFYTDALQHLEAAGDCYLKAGVQHASEYTKATKLFFDAYAYLDNASKVTDHGKQTSLYSLAEKILQSSADSYAKAGYPLKRDQVSRLLANVRQKHDLAISLAEVIGTPPGVSSTPLVTSPPSFEGTLEEKSQYPEIQSNLATPKKYLTIGEPFPLTIQLANSSAKSGQLLKLEHMIPRGLTLVETPHNFTVEGTHLNLKGKRLEPLKTEEVVLTLNPTAKGPFELRPRIVYSDEDGNIRTRQLDPLEITVRDRRIEGASVGAKIVLASTEYFVGESFEEVLEIGSEGEAPAILESVENSVGQGVSVTNAKGGSFTSEGHIELNSLILEPAQSHRLTLTLKATGLGKVSLGSSIIFKDESGNTNSEQVSGCEIVLYPFSIQMEFLAKAFVEDYVRKRLSYEQSGWRGLMDIVSSLRIPKSQAYGEVRYGHTFGRPLEALVRSGLVEYRTFRGKGRGGNVLRVRACYERDPVKRLVDRLASSSSPKNPLEHSS